MVLVSLFACGAGHAITLEQIREVYEHKFDYLKSYRIEFTLHTTRFSDKEKRTLKSTSRTAYERYVRDRKLGIKKFEIDLASEEVSPGYWKAYNGKYMRSVSYYDGAIVSGRVETLTDRSRYNMSVYHPMALVGLHSAVIGDERIRPIGNSFTTDIRSLTLYRTTRILPETEVVNGHKCCIVEAPADSGDPSYFRAWLALDLDLALVKREARVYAPSGVETMLYSIECDDFRELQPGFFLPQKITVEGFRASESEFRAASAKEYIITSVELNPDIPDEAFEIEFPNGTRVKDEIMNVSFVQGQAPSLNAAVEEDIHSLAEAVEKEVLSDIVKRPSPMAVQGGSSTRRARSARRLALALILAIVVTTVASTAYRKLYRSQQRIGTRS